VRVELTVAILSDFAVFGSVDNEWLVASGRKLLSVRVVDLERHSLATKPIADVISIAICKSYAYSLVKEVLEILAEVREDEVARVLELVVDVAVGCRVVQVDTNGILHMCLVEVRGQVRRRRRVIARVTDIVGTTAGKA